MVAATENYNARGDRDAVALTDIDQAVKEYQSKPHTPELVTKVHQVIWQARRERLGLIGVTCKVTPCPYTQEELKDLEQKGRRLGFLPTELASQLSRYRLGQMFPEMGSGSVKEGNDITNDESPSGWFDYETAVDAPYLDTVEKKLAYEKQLTERILKDGRKLLSLNQYIVAGQDSKLLTGRYLDEEKTWTRLGSRRVGHVIGALFYPDGKMFVFFDFQSFDRVQALRGRSSGVKSLKL